MDSQPGAFLGHYELLSKIGEGGMGVVWKARDTHLDRIVALKVLCNPCNTDRDRLVRFDREARVLAALRHPGIVTIYSIEEAEETPFITMEFVDGITLARSVPPAGLPLGTFFSIAEPLVDAVAAAHAQGIAHRDLKPSNVLVTGTGDVKVLDFGIAAIVETGAVSTHADSEGETRGVEVVGTPPFMAPEQLLKQAPDHRADLFSVGSILYFMLAGRPPFVGDSTAAIAAAILRDEPAPLQILRPEVPPPLVEAVERCLEKRPEQRFQTATQLGRALLSARMAAPVEMRQPIASLAVLPFDDLSAGKDQDYFCEGIAEEIILSLTRVKGLRVASRSAALAAKARVADRRELAAYLGVETLLEGSIRKSGQHVRITVELTDVATQSQLWAERYDRDLEDVFAIQDDIAGRVAEALCCRLSELQRQALHHRPTPGIQAYDFYLRGRKFLHQYSRKGAEFASRMFSNALEIDPLYARAHAGIAECYAFLYLYAGRHPVDLARAADASRRAVELAPDSAEAHAARGTALSLAGRIDCAIEEFETALRLNAELFDVNYLYARTCFAAGRFADAVRLWERASELQPDDYQSPLLVAQAYEQLGRAADAEAARRRGAKVAAEHLQLYPDDARALYMGANGLVALGRIEEGLTWARQARALDPDEPMLLYNLACIHALAGDSDTAFVCLERAVANGLSQREWLLNDTNLDSLRGDRRFEQVLALTGAPAAG